MPTLDPGVRLGPYEIRSLLGKGGMGEVYRARDGRLGRDIAIKVLPRSFVEDPDRLKRFEREARAAGQLNHPNVIAVHDVGSDGTTPFIVSELLEGEDLRVRLSNGPIPPRRAVGYAIQIARGLSAAHAKGIAHRDLKPENVMIVAGDHVKILDFGLAKLLDADPDDPDKTGPIHAQLTAAGTILGTASYMSPEQIRQQPTDHRTDIFALGAMLYEMLAGSRAFQGDTHADRMSAILSREPEPLSAEIEEAAPGVSAVIEHCLDKHAEDRFDTARDLAFALSLVEATAAARRAAGAGAGAASGAARAREESGAHAGTLRQRHTFRRATYRIGHILSARFAPDGQGVCYGAAWEGRPVELYWSYPGNPESRALGFPKTDLYAISSTGEMAVSLRRVVKGGFLYSGMLARMPVGGGAPREVLDNVLEADWSPDGRSLLVIREAGGKTHIEFPIGKVIYQTNGWVSHARVSRDGKHVAFLDHPVRGDDMGGPSIVDMEGRVRHLSTGWSSARGMAWSPSGSEIVFTAFRTGVGRSLYAVTPDGVERPILEVPGHITLLDISRQGDALIALERERSRTEYFAAGSPAVRDLTWLDWTLVRGITSDGSRIVFDETGVGGGELHSVFSRGVDGAPAIRLGDGACLDLSPDGNWVLAGVGYAPARLDLLPCGAGTARTIPAEGLDVQNAAWFPDGESICILAQEPGRGTRLYKVDSVTGRASPFTDEGISSFDALVSPDGATVAALGPNLALMLYPVAGGPAAPVPGMRPTDRPIRWSADGKALFAFTRGAIPTEVLQVDVATGERTPLMKLAPSDSSGVDGLTTVRMTADGRSIVFSYSQLLNDLYVVEGLF